MSQQSDQLRVRFQLRQLEQRRLEIRVDTHPDIGSERTESPMPSKKLLTRLAKLKLIDFPPNVIKSAGSGLYHCLINGDIAVLVSDLLRRGINQKRSVEFELRFDPDPDQEELIQYPWEMICDDLERFLVRDGHVDMTRFINLPEPPPTFEPSIHNKKFLRVVSQPAGLTTITATDLPLEKLETLPHATFSDFQQKLIVEELDIWGSQFDGHGAIRNQCSQCGALNKFESRRCGICGTSLSGLGQVGVLAFERNDKAEWIAAHSFGSTLLHADVQLALLLACESAFAGNQFIFNGLAQKIILSGVPCVIGMQYPIHDRFANSFAKAFYTSLLDEKDVLNAVRTARKIESSSEWYNPILYKRHQRAITQEQKHLLRHIDTAVPATVQAGNFFLVHAWIRRPETERLIKEQLRRELNVPESVSIERIKTDANVVFKQAKGTNLRLGEVEIQLETTRCEVPDDTRGLRLVENLDGPIWYFKVRAMEIGSEVLIFSVRQDGYDIASVVHSIEVVRRGAKAEIHTNTATLPYRDTTEVHILSSGDVVTKSDGTGLQCNHDAAPANIRFCPVCGDRLRRVEEAEVDRALTPLTRRYRRSPPEIQQISLEDTRRHLKNGVDVLANAVASTLGTKGRNVALDRKYGSPTIAHDGVTVAKEIKLEDPYENMGAQLLKDAATKVHETTGDGASKSTVIARAIVRDGLESLATGSNPMLLKQGIEVAAKAASNAIAKQAIEVTTKEEIAAVAAISAQDSEIGELIAEVMDKVGKDGVITVEESKGLEFETEYVEGMQFDRGYISPYFVTDPAKMEAVVEEPYLLILDKKISIDSDITPIIEKLIQIGERELVVIAEDIDGEALAMLVLNKIRGMLNVVAVKAPGFGDRRKAILQDIAILTGGTVITEELDRKLESVTINNLGKSGKVVVTKYDTTIVEGAGVADKIKGRTEEIKVEIDRPTSDYEKEKLQERLAILSSGVAVIGVGAATETELNEKKHRVEDALSATRAAVEEGAVPGGGVALLNAFESKKKLKVDDEDANIGVNIVRQALEMPMRGIVENSGKDGAVVIEMIRRKHADEENTNIGYDVLKEEYVNMVETGIIDPAKVTKSALENAASIAAMILTTEALITTAPERERPLTPIMTEY